MPTRLGNLGYFALKKEATKGTAVVPNVYVPIYDESLITNVNLDLDNPIVGNKFQNFQAIQGMRDHQGEVTLLAEPNTAGYILDMILKKGTTTGSGPYTHPFTLSTASDPNSYTVDILKGQVVFRFTGVEVGSLGIDFDDNKMQFKAKLSGLKSFITREIASIVTDTLTLKTTYDPTPTDGLVVGDLVRVYDVSAGTTQDFTVLAITATTVQLSGSPSGLVDGDLLSLRGATPSYSLLTPFMWARSEFRFAATAADALSATQTRLEDGSGWELVHEFEDDAGAKRSGSFDPAAMVRKQGYVNLSARAFFDTPEDVNRFLANQKRACVIRHFSESGYELRVTLNNMRATESPIDLASNEVLYAEQNFASVYDTSDAQAFDIKLLNAVATI